MAFFYFRTGKLIGLGGFINKNIAIILHCWHVFLKMKMLFKHGCGLLAGFKS